MWTSIRSGRPSIAQNCFAHGPGAITTCSPTSIRPALVGRPSTLSSAPNSKPVDLDAGEHRHAFGLALAERARRRTPVEGEAALVLVEADGDALRAPVREERLHVSVDLGLAEDQLRAVADPLVPLVDGDEVLLLHRGPSAMYPTGL